MENILTPNEVLIIQMSLQQTIDDLTVNLNNPALPFSPDARKDMRDMYNNAVSAKAKIAKGSGHEVKMERYKDGDEQEFFTKES